MVSNAGLQALIENADHPAIKACLLELQQYRQLEMFQAARGAEIMIGFLLEYAERHAEFEKVSKRNANVTRRRLLDLIAKLEDIK